MKANRVKVGDRVRWFEHENGVYDSSSDPVGSFMRDDQRSRAANGTVTAVKCDTVQVQRDGPVSYGSHRALHFRECHRLVKPKPAREWELAGGENGQVFVYGTSAIPQGDRVTVREVRTRSGGAK